jgi:hypothetical protein
MTLTKTLVTSAVVALVLTTSACGPGSKSEPEAEQPAASESSQQVTPSTAEEEVTYEPAYPTDVSEEGLTEEDVEQQEAGHSHGPGAADHAHEDGTTHTPDGTDDKHQR